MRFEIKFHTPFRVASGQAGDGSDIIVDPHALLPASSLKGVMRSAARDLLRFPSSLVNDVFGAARSASPWSWSDARVLAADGNNPGVRPRARIQIKPETSTTVKGALLIADEVLADRAEFTVERTGWIEGGEVSSHETVLLAASRAVTAIGGNRRRGLGWVTIVPMDPAWSPAHLDAAVKLAGGADHG